MARPGQYPLTHGINIVDWDFANFPPEVIVLLHPLLGTVDVVGEVVVTQVLPEVVKSVQHVRALPKEVLKGLEMTKRRTLAWSFAGIFGWCRKHFWVE